MNIVASLQQSLKEEIKQAVLNANLADETQLPVIVLETPKEKAHGDYSTNIAMQLARVAKKAPRQIAEDIINSFQKEKVHVEKIEIAGPGFINFHMNNSY